MPDDPYEDEPFDDSVGPDPYSVNDDPPPPVQQAMPAQRVVYCTGCGAQLQGASIGQPCSSCGMPIGSAAAAGQTSGKAITAMVLGICSIPTCFCYGIFSIIIGIVGLVFASMADKDIDRGGFSNGSKGMALAGKICSWIGVALGVGYILFIVIIIVIAESGR